MSGMVISPGSLTLRLLGNVAVRHGICRSALGCQEIKETDDSEEKLLSLWVKEKD